MEKIAGGFKVLDAEGQSLAYVYGVADDPTIGAAPFSVITPEIQRLRAEGIGATEIAKRLPWTCRRNGSHLRPRGVAKIEGGG